MISIFSTLRSPLSVKLTKEFVVVNLVLVVVNPALGGNVS
jgi:hypothetical protein